MSTGRIHSIESSKAPAIMIATAQTDRIGNIVLPGKQDHGHRSRSQKEDSGQQALRPGRGSASPATWQTAPTPIAAKKVTPKYQNGRRRPFQSFQRALKIPGSSSGRANGSG